MADLVPIPLHLLLRRAFLEYQREGKIFDLPKSKFFRGIPGLDLSVSLHGHRASTPLGPAAGPHGQMAQNIVLSWLGGSRVIELKTIQILDELKIPRPCIDIANVGYNVEWSQELKLEQSLREYAGGAMLIEILKASRLLGEDFEAGETVFDMSAGYSLEGIRSPRVRSWIESMKNAGPVIDELRGELTGPWARYRDLPFPTRISDTVSLSTFHGCPAGEIEGIVGFLLNELDVDVCVKLNPTLLGCEEVERLLRDVLGYREIRISREAFENDLQWDEAMDLIPRMQRMAQARGKRLSVKFSNTLVVKNHKSFFSDEQMYLSGAPLHVITMSLVKKFRASGIRIPISFSAGLDANNVAGTVAMNFVPVTACTDLLRPGGFARLIRYLENLGAKMREHGATRIPDFVVRFAGQGAAAIAQVVREMRLPQGGAGGSACHSISQLLNDWLQTPREPLDAVCARIGIPGLEQALVDAAGALNTPVLVDAATANPRYAWERNKGTPRKIGSKLWLYDCINCDKCVPVCPNDANFVYETFATAIPYHNFELVAPPVFAGGVLPAGTKVPGAVRRVPGGIFQLANSHQLANWADACNECGNCDVFCPEDGGPYVEKPRFFGSLDSYRRHARINGFYIDWPAQTIYGTIAGESFALAIDRAAGRARFTNAAVETEIRLSDNEALSWRPAPGAAAVPAMLDMLPYLKLKLMMESIGDPRRVHFANVQGLQEAAIGN